MLKRNTPAWAVPQSPSVKHELKDEPGEEPDAKRVKTGNVKPILTATHGMFKENRTAAYALLNQLKKSMTIGWEDAFFWIQDTSPGSDPTEALEIFKTLERVEFNKINRVFTYIPELTLTTTNEIRNHIRIHSTPTSGIPIKTLREAMPNGIEPLKDLEARGDILIMRGLTGAWKDIPLPRLGRKNVNGQEVMEGGSGRWKTVFWDHLREAGRAGKRVDDEFIYSWADVPIAETDDVTKLLADQGFSASSAIPIAPKAIVTAASKKKKKRTRALKITNTHMKEQGIDFSKDYVKPV
ncbi:transcription initiation factor TFIIE subunit beta [Cryptococcus gattii E566]|uniref:TFIIE beta domain-containing protein n=3 Tax=Cryptococcus gattii species complex TaxID=1884637 RepID=E6RCF9_CRYGW|nr:uncharacterized protein CGB_I4140W [Cryptococcus gattii WM276]ADV24471.1 hypothetical protein CNH03590 [Cryptococcus gattii WM276]KIR76154.1 transcription initiation factor TFIIE subunit beta [Cryptococcus gattii EJB2]KIY30894.1 transcription initiation factor TFIIE subunit beta [Cryptococcus gattii E566]KJE01909.1 transcription initiation factor TFIIE subunit beta [Cryptococcus gattii NT-10]